MSESQLLQQISQKESDKQEIARKVIKKPELLSEMTASAQTRPA